MLEQMYAAKAAKRAADKNGTNPKTMVATVHVVSRVIQLGSVFKAKHPGRAAMKMAAPLAAAKKAAPARKKK